MRADFRYKRHNIHFLENFLFAGSSALLLSVAHLYPEYWFISLFALVSFLWRVISVSLLESIVLGSLLATSYFIAMTPVASWATPGGFLLKLLSLNILFALYGALVNRLAKNIGLNVIFIAALWLPLEYGISHCAHLGSIFSFPETDSTLLFRIGSLFGMLMVSFFVVLINLLILIFSKHLLRTLCYRVSFSEKADKRPYPSFKEIIIIKIWHFWPEQRGPPLFIQSYL